MIKTYLFFLLSMFILDTSTGICQLLIRGNVFFHDSKEQAIGCSVIILENVKPDSIIPKNLHEIKLDDIGDIEGSFEVKVNSNESIDLLIHFLGYRNTIIKNITKNTDTIDLHTIPLFIDDQIYGFETLVSTKKYLWGLIKKQHTYSQPMGIEGPFSYEDELIINCEDNSKEGLHCIKGLNGIEIEYDELDRCW